MCAADAATEATEAKSARLTPELSRAEGVGLNDQLGAARHQRKEDNSGDPHSNQADYECDCGKSHAVGRNYRHGHKAQCEWHTRKNRNPRHRNESAARAATRSQSRPQKGLSK